MQIDRKFSACCFSALAGSQSGSQSTYDTVSVKNDGRHALVHGRCTASGVPTAGASVNDVRPGKDPLTIAERRDLIDELTRNEWRLPSGPTMEQITAHSRLNASGVRK